jgi:2-polyprenyl-6-methoxyphenol hydroxylase-like FAD-dependent oxidoreductase
LRLTSDMKMDTDILIVGGGVSGSAMGAALVNSGHRVICIDQGTGGPLDTARGDHISPANVEVLAEWGVLKDFFAAGATKRIGHQFKSSEGETLLSGEYAEMGAPYPYFLVINHELITPTFMNFAQTDPNFVLLRPYSVKDLEVTDGNVTNVLATNREGEEIQIRARVVIACDGASSTVREKLRVPCFEHPYKRPLVILFANRPATLLPDNYFLRFAGDDGQLFVLQRMDGAIKVTLAVGDEGIPWWKKSTNEERQKIVGTIAPELADCELEVSGFYPVRMIHAIDYAIGNVVLIGDAAHAIHPARGQGLNMGIASLKTLLPLIPSPEEISNPEAVKLALAEFHRIQRPLNERIIARNHSAAMEMEMGADENRAFVLKKSNAAIKAMAEDPRIRKLHLNEATGYHFGVPAKA